jgi:hypothetical protein
VSIDLPAREATSSLDRLCSAAPGVFTHEVWARRAWLSLAADLPGCPSDLFSRAAADELLSRRGLRTPFVRMARDGVVIPASRFTGSGGAGATIGDQVHDDDVLGLFADGATIVLQGLHRTWEPVRRLAAGLSAELGHPVQVNSYITPPQSQGFAAHYDTHDVFVMQITGRKRWTVHEPVHPDPLPDEPWEAFGDSVRHRAAQPPALQSTLEPGDCLYLPRGFIHSAAALGETSIHLTFGIHAVTERDVARAMLDAVLDDTWRASLPAGWTPTGDDLSEVRDRAVKALAAIDLERVAGALADARAAKQRPEPLAPLAQADAAAQLTASTRVRLRQHLGARLTPIGLHVEGRDISLTDDERPAVALLLDGAPHDLADLPLPPQQAVGLARTLLHAGVLVPSAPPE